MTMRSEPMTGFPMPRGLHFSECGARGSVVVFSYPIEDAGPKLTDAERQVALRLLAGQSNAEIAEARGCAVRTICNQIQSLYRKLGVSSRAELAATMPVLG